MSGAFTEETLNIRWSELTPENARKEIPQALQAARDAVEDICCVSEPNYDNTFGALDRCDEPLSRAWQRLTHLHSVADTKELREALAELMPSVVEFSVSLLLDERLYAVLKAAADAPALRGISPTQRRFAEETLNNFRDNGAELPAAQKKRAAEIAKRIAELSRRFGEAVLDSTNAWEYVTEDPNELVGLPEGVLEAARRDAREKNYGSEEHPAWRFTLQFTSARPVLTYARDERLRRRIWEGMQTRGTGRYDTQEMIHELLRLRAEKAQLLGFGSYADYAAARRMAASGGNALKFIDDLHDRVKPAYAAEEERLRLFAEEVSGHAVPRLNPWDAAYYTELLRKKLYDFDAEQLRPYFPLRRVLRGMFGIYEELYGIRITEVPAQYLKPGETLRPGATEVWHPDVLCFRIDDALTGEHLASFYTDWYPRENKRAGAWMDCLSCGCPPMHGRPRVPHLALICGNLNRPTDEKPSLLSHDEAETVFHEFGHLLHQALSEVEVRGLAGCNVAWDFVELPSQINENWTWEAEVQERISAHWQTGETLPPELQRKMLAARNFAAASAFMRQLSFGKLDLELHHRTALYAGRDIEEIDRDILHDYRVERSCPSVSILRTFTHIFDGGYEAGYYSYKWAEMLEADAFTRFAEEGIFNPKTGRDFRRCILSRGNSCPPARLFRDFMGRDPEPEALLRRAGITPTP